MTCRGAALCCSPAFLVWDKMSRSELVIDILVYLPLRSYNIGRRTTHPFLQEVAAMIVLKILTAPFVVVLTILAAVVSFLFCMASAVCVVACVVLTLLAVVLFIGGQTLGGIVFLVLAFLISPYGIPATRGTADGSALFPQLCPEGIHRWLTLRSILSQSTVKNGGL